MPILVIYRKYYGTRMMLFILGSFYATMVAAGYLVEILFNLLGLVPTTRDAKVGEMGVQWNYTTVLNIVAILGGRRSDLPVRPIRWSSHVARDERCA